MKYIKDIHLLDLLIFLMFLVITTGGLLLRSFLNFNGNSHVILNSLGNIGGVIVGSFLFIWWRKESSFKEREIIIFSVGVGLTIYEFIQVVMADF
jgi:membrane associated rhomboid family serine protease